MHLLTHYVAGKKCNKHYDHSCKVGQVVSLNLLTIHQSIQFC